MTTPKPGSWREVPDDEPVVEMQRPAPEIYSCDEMINMYRVFATHVYNPRSVLYPSCGFDASPSKAFDNVTFVDKEHGNEGCVKALRAAGHRAFKMNIADYKPETLHDLLIILNPACSPHIMTPHLAQGGFIIANNYHLSATKLHEHGGFALKGCIDFGANKVNISQNLEGLFEPVADFDELVRLDPQEASYVQSYVHSFAAQIPGLAQKPFEEQWARYREEMHFGMPTKRSAMRYVFQKV